jgi:hypothetical protein
MMSTLSLRRLLRLCVCVGLLGATGASPRSIGLEPDVRSVRLQPDQSTGTRAESAKPSLHGTAATDYLKQQGTYGSLQEAITATRYRVHPVSAGTPVAGQTRAAYRAPNPEQGFDALFTPDQVRLVPRAVDDKAPTWKLGVTLTGYGYGDRLEPVGAGTMTTRDNRIEIARPRLATADLAVIEWYVNRGAGLEQGFTVPEPPDGRTAGEPLRLQLAIAGSLRATLPGAADAITFVDPQGTAVLTYDHLVVTDADGRPLASRFAIAEGTVSILVADGSARYPLTIDPTFAQQAYLKASNPDADDRFGYSIAISGDTVAVGAPFENSVATGVNGNQGDNTASDSGAVYVFVRNTGTWSQQAYIKASTIDSGDRFGYSVAISGDTVAVGAPGEDSVATGVNGNQGDNTASHSGAMYVFVRNAGIWSQQAYIKASTIDSGDEFGYSVAISGDTVAVGAPGEDSVATGVNGNQGNNTASHSGAMYVFVRNAGTWSQQAYIKASTIDSGDLFGWDVSVSGDTIVVGARWEDSGATGVGGSQSDNTMSGAGAAYVFVRSGGTWSQQAYLKASNTQIDDLFGSSVAVSGDTAVVSANGEDSNTSGVNGDQSNNLASDAGAAYVFVRSGGTWSQQAYLKASNTDALDNFGNDVALSGDTIVVGAFQESSNATGVDGNQGNDAAPGSGAAYVFMRSGGAWTQQAYLKASNTESSDAFGASVAVSGDTVVVGASGEGSNTTGVDGDQGNNAATAAGASYVYYISNYEPVCTPSTQTILLPANNQMLDITVTGVSDPESQPLIITATSIRQDEKTRINALDPAPDATLSPLRIRKQRGTAVNPGNGRYYHIGYTASDGALTCNSEVTVIVPGNPGPTVDGGSLYNSLVP